MCLEIASVNQKGLVSGRPAEEVGKLEDLLCPPGILIIYVKGLYHVCGTRLYQRSDPLSEQMLKAINNI